MSESKIKSDKFLVAVWANVTVASTDFCESKIDNGLPTVVPRPIIKIFAPSKLTLYSRNKESMAFGVQGIIEFLANTKFPRLIGCNPSASFFGSI